MSTRANVKMVRRINLATTLRIIREQGPISRADIAKVAELSPTTVSALVDHLIKEKLVAPLGEGESSGGRRPIMLRFCPESRLAIGVEASLEETRIGLADLDGTILHRITLPTILSNSDEFLAQLKTGIDEMLHFGKKLSGEILGIGVTVPGLVSKNRQVLVYSASLGFHAVPIVENLTQHYNLPVVLENDMNAAALGEKSMGAGKGVRDLIYVSISHGIGAGIIINNQIYTGHNGRAGEVGHMTMDLHGPLCECGSRGCLGPMAAGPGMLAKAAHFLAINIETKLRDLTNNGTEPTTLQHLQQAITAKDPVALTVIEECMEYVGAGIANLITVWDPPLIILGGSFIDIFGDTAIKLIQASATRRVLPLYINQPLPIVPYELGEDVGVLGAVTLVFAKFLTPTYALGDTQRL